MLTASAPPSNRTAGQRRYARDVAQLGQRTCFGSRGSPVQIRPSRPSRLSQPRAPTRTFRRGCRTAAWAPTPCPGTGCRGEVQELLEVAFGFGLVADQVGGDRLLLVVDHQPAGAAAGGGAPVGAAAELGHGDRPSGTA